MKNNVLLCSPKGLPGGISQWTDNILDAANKYHSKDLDIEWFYSDLSGSNTYKKKLSPVSRIINGIKMYIPFIKGLRNKLKRNNYDTIHMSTSGSIAFLRDWLALRIAKKHGLHTALHLHFGRMPEVLKSNSLEYKLFKKCCKYTDEIISMDKLSYQALCDYSLKNVHNLPNPLSDTINALISEHGNKIRNKNNVLFVGHVYPEKGVYELIKACNNIPDIHLDIIGLYTEDVKDDIVNNILHGDTSRITFYGNIPHNKVIEEMQECTIFALPSYTEGFPNVIIESMACGCPIVATPVGAIPEMLDFNESNPCGIRAEKKDVKTLQQAIETFLSNPQLAKEYGERARYKVNAVYSLKVVYNQLEKIWNGYDFKQKQA